MESDSHQELLRRVDQLTEDYHQERLDHARESHFNRDVQRRELELQEELRKYKTVMVGPISLADPGRHSNALLIHWVYNRTVMRLSLCCLTVME